MTIENFNDQYLKEVLWDSLKKKKHCKKFIEFYKNTVVDLFSWFQEI